MSAFKSPFEKLSYEAQDSMAKSVNPGGALYSLLERLVKSSEGGIAPGGGIAAGGKVSKEALAAIEGLGLASKRLAGAIAIIAASKPNDVEKFFSVFTSLKQTLIEDIDEKTAALMFQRSLVIGAVSDNILKFGHNLAIFAAMTPVILFGALAFATTMTIVKYAIARGDFWSNVFGVFVEDQLRVMADGIMKMGLVLVAFAALSPVILIGAMAFWLTMVIIKNAIDRIGAGNAPGPTWFARVVLGKRSAMAWAILNTKRIAWAVFTFGLVMTLASPLLVVGLIGAMLFWTAMKFFIAPTMKLLGDKRRLPTWKRAFWVSLLITGAMIILLPAMVVLAAIAILSPLIILGAIALRFVLPIIGQAYGALGKMMSQIAQGAIALGLIGLSLIPLAIGMVMFAEAFKATQSPWEFMGWTIAVTSGLGVAMTGLGALVALTAGAAFLGPLMIAAIGGSLIALAAGLNAFQKVKWKDENTKQLTTALAGVKVAFMGTEEKQEGGFFAAIGGALKGAMDSAKIVASAAGYMAAGVALIVLSKGLTKFKEIKWKDTDTFELTSALTGISGAFAAIGGQDQAAAGGFAGLIGLSRSKTEEGILSVLSAGRALNGIAGGLQSFQKLIDSGIKFGLPDGNGVYPIGTMGYAVTQTMGFINQAFAAVADQGNVEAGGFFASLAGIKKNKVAEGIESVTGAGDVLQSVADGLIKFQKMAQQKIDWDALGKSIVTTLGFVQKAFSAIADQGNVEAGGFFASLAGIKKNKVAEGIESVSGAGDELNSIADALNKFKGLEDPKVIANNIEGVLGLVADSFSQVEKFDDVDDAIDLFEAAAEMYENIADASNDMNIEAIETSARMFEALGYLSTHGGSTSIELLGENLVEAIHELAAMIANFEGTVETAASSNESLIDKVSKYNPFKDTGATIKNAKGEVIGNTKTGSASTHSLSQDEVVRELKRLHALLSSGDVSVNVEENSGIFN